MSSPPITQITHGWRCSERRVTSKVIVELNFEWDVMLTQSLLVKKGQKSLGPYNSKVIAFFTSQVWAAALSLYYLGMPAVGGRAFTVANKLK